MKNIKSWYRATAATLVATTCCVGAASATGEVDAPLKALIELILGLIKLGGVLLAIYGVVQIVISMSSHDATQRMTGVWMFAAGLVLAFLKTIMNSLGVTW